MNIGLPFFLSHYQRCLDTYNSKQNLHEKKNKNILQHIIEISHNELQKILVGSSTQATGYVCAVPHQQKNTGKHADSARSICLSSDKPKFRPPSPEKTQKNIRDRKKLAVDKHIF
jgi:hypothetical protein